MIEDIKRFLIVVEEGSITRAAEKLYLTQPALSQAIKRLGNQVGSKLFRQNGKKLLLTKRGEAAVVVFKRIIMLWEGFLQEKKYFEKEIYTVGIYDNAAMILSPFFKVYFDRNEVDLEIIIDNSETLFSQFIYGVLDICICIYDETRTTPSHGSLIATYPEKLLAVSSHGQKGSFERTPFILYNTGSVTRKYIDKVFIKQNLQPRVIAESTSPLFMKELAILGSGVALLPENFVKEDLQSGKLQIVPLSLHFERIVSIYINTTGVFSQKNLFLENIKNILVSG